MKTRSKNCTSRNGASAPVSSSCRNFTRPASPSLNWTKRQQSGSGFTSTTSQYIERYLAQVSGSIFAGGLFSRQKRQASSNSSLCIIPHSWARFKARPGSPGGSASAGISTLILFVLQGNRLRFGFTPGSPLPEPATPSRCLPSMLEALNLTKTFIGPPAVDSVSFTIRPGEILGYLGPNGAGKSTTVKMLTGLLEPTSGRVLFHGQDIRRDLKGFQRRLGYVPEEPPLYPPLSGREYLHLPGQLGRASCRERE